MNKKATKKWGPIKLLVIGDNNSTLIYNNINP